MRSLLLFAILFAGACATVQQQTRMVTQTTQDWRRVATDADRARLRDWRETFVQATAAARRAGYAEHIAREGALLEPDAALGGPVPNGDYRCRVIKLGAKSEGMLDFVTYPAFTCRVAPQSGLQQFTKLTGSQRPAGLIYPGDFSRQVFLGTLVLGDEGSALRYGLDESRNVAGYIERIEPARWRLMMPRPHFESQLDIMELAPAVQDTRQ
jgi:hypothetical protein